MPALKPMSLVWLCVGGVVLLLISGIALFAVINSSSSSSSDNESASFASFATEQATAVLSRADPHLNDHAHYLLFAHHLGAVDTAEQPDLHGRVLHKTKSTRALWNTLASATTHTAARLMGWNTGQPKTSLRRTPDAHLASRRRRTRVLMKKMAFDATGEVKANVTSEEEAESEAAASSAYESDDESEALHATYLVHFAPSVSLNSTVLEEFTRLTGLTLGEYFPHNSYVLVASESAMAAIRDSLPHELVDWIGEYPNEAKAITPELAYLMRLGEEQQEAEPALASLSLNIQLQPVPAAPIARTLEQLQETADLLEHFLSHHSLPPFDIVVKPSFHNNLLILHSRGSMTAAEAARLLSLLTEVVEVAFVEKRMKHVIRNKVASTITQSGTVVADGAPLSEGRPIWSQGLMGEGQIVGCADSGLDWDHCMFEGATAAAPTKTLRTTARKVIAYVPFADTSDDENGHGTHVVGSIAGNALDVTAASGEIASHSGEAPNAKIYFQDIGETGGGLSGLNEVGDLGSGLFAPAYAAGARIHSDSWGSSSNRYTTEAQSVDQFIWQSGGKTDQHMLILIAAGNDGLKQGSVQATVGSPATAKNILAVGASQTSTAGWLASTDFTDWEEKRLQAAEQLGVSSTSFDCCSYRSNPKVPKFCCQSAVQAAIKASPKLHSEPNMADFSSRGPTLDGRVKPEIVAPGQYIVSARSDGLKSGANQCTTMKNALLSMAGTSMATPTAAGNAALVRQYLTEGWYPGGRKGSSSQFSNPSAALLAAILINGAQSLTGTIDQNNDGEVYRSLAGGIFPLLVFQGFGRVTLDRSLWFEGETRYRQWMEDQRAPLQTGQDADYCVTATATSASGLKATLVWHDAPGSVGGGVASVNNLDLYMGNSVEDAVAGNFVVRRDILNNAESGTVGTRAGQTVFVKVRAINVPRPQQYYALVLSGSIDPSSVQIGSVCGADTKFVINATRFAETTESDHFPLGPVVGGTIGGAAGLAILIYIIRYIYQRYQQGKII